MITNLRCSAGRARELYPKRGLGLTWTGPHSTGSTYGEPGTDRFIEVCIHAWWHWSLYLTWKRLP